MDYTGIHLVRTTGKTTPEQYLEVYDVVPGSQMGTAKNYFYARPCQAFGDIVAPSEEWLSKYKDEIFICVVYEQGNPNAPLWIGYTPIDGKLSDVPEDYPNGYIKRTEKFFIRIDDKKGEAHISFRSDNCKIILGEYDVSKEPAVLGDTTVSLLKEFIEAVKTIVLATPAGNTTGVLTLPKFEALEQKVDKILSKSVTLD